MGVRSVRGVVRCALLCVDDMRGAICVERYAWGVLRWCSTLGAECKTWHQACWRSEFLHVVHQRLHARQRNGVVDAGAHAAHGLLITLGLQQAAPWRQPGRRRCGFRPVGRTGCSCASGRLAPPCSHRRGEASMKVVQPAARLGNVALTPWPLRRSRPLRCFLSHWKVRPAM